MWLRFSVSAPWAADAATLIVIIATFKTVFLLASISRLFAPQDHDSDDDDDDYDDEGASLRFFSSFLSLLRLRIGYLMELILVIIPSLLES